MTELALPAGSLQCALHAFKGGADAVYFGLKSFSARKGAVNFSFEDIRKLKAIGKATGKKFYVTLNTLLDDKDYEDISILLNQLSYVEPDGVIVQDLGLVKYINEFYPNLPLHGSTQLAVHNSEGVRALADMNFRRVVLARELTFEEIKRIREECPTVELKVFIHGALCYGFSGLCMASQIITGRSANHGECAQICRTWFRDRELGKSGWFFSMKDLALGEEVTKLKNIGIDSLKVEGRMKGAEYTYYTAFYYRLLLDGESPSSSKVLWAKEAMEASFARETTKGFFSNASDLVSADYPEHRGFEIGKLLKVLKGKAIVKFSRPAALRDGLMVLADGESIGFSLMKIENGRSFVSEGETAEINFPSDFRRKPEFGAIVYCTSRHNLNLPSISENIQPYKKPIEIEMEIRDSSIRINDQVCEFPVSEARESGNLEEIVGKIFSSSAESFFTIGNITVKNSSNFINPFLPLSALKQTRRAFFSVIDEAFLSDSGKIIPFFPQIAKAKLPSRKLLGLWDKIVEVEGEKYMCLSPVNFDEKTYLSYVDEIIKKNKDIIIGLSNVGQIRWAAQHPETRFFADYFLYTSNTLAYAYLKDLVPSLIGAVRVEEEDGFSPPLFISRVCYRKSILNLSCDNCSKNNTYRIEQNGLKYRVTCKNCSTIVEKDY